MNKTGIAWTMYTLNLISGCSHVSEGCRYCYAELMMRRLAKMFPGQYSTLPWTKANVKAILRFFPERRKELYRLQRCGHRGPVFLNSMADIFHEDVPDAWRALIFDMIWRCPDVICIILTKRSEHALTWRDWPPNVWLLATVENTQTTHRIATLQSIPARIKGLSCEPLLEPLGELDFRGLQWVIVGGESGPHARPMEGEWARDIQRQCHAQGVAFFMKQLSQCGNQAYSKFDQFPPDLQERAYPEAITPTW